MVEYVDILEKVLSNENLYVLRRKLIEMSWKLSIFVNVYNFRFLLKNTHTLLYWHKTSALKWRIKVDI